MHTFLKTAGLAIATLTVAVFSSAPSFAGGLYDPPGSLKDGPPVRTYQAAGPCYFRGDVGYSAANDGDIRWPVTSYPGGTPTYLGDTVSNQSFDDTWFGEIGVGCGSGSRGLRADFTFGYRGKRNITGEPLPYVPPTPPPGTIDDPLHTSLTSYTAMVNIYGDLGRYGNFVPYVGVGLGVAYHKMDGVYFTGNPGLVNTIEGNSDVTFAWALMAGFGYQISDRMILDVGYRYMDLGDAKSGRVDSAGFVNPPVRIEDMTAHEFKVGLRYHFGSTGPILK